MTIPLTGLALGLVALAGVSLPAQIAEEADLRPRRLFFGAPPQVPHEVGVSANECLSCHDGPGAEASQTPHPSETHCQQCHVVGDQKALGAPIPHAGLHAVLVGEFAQRNVVQ